MVKILNVLFVLTGLLLFESCTDDDFKRESDNPRIQGEWKQTLTYSEISGETLPTDYDAYYTLYNNNTGYPYYRGTVAEIEWSFVYNAFRYRYLGSALEEVWQWDSSNLSRTKRATVTGTAIKADIAGLTNGETYYFRAKAKNSVGEGTSETVRIIYQWRD